MGRRIRTQAQSFRDAGASPRTRKPDAAAPGLWIPGSPGFAGAPE